MNKLYLRGLASGLISVLMAGPVLAESTGEDEFLNSCANCHGADGKGGGTIVAYLNAKLPDLSQLKKKNDGTFPVEYVLWMIDGRNKLQIHGGDMPVWGDRYMAVAKADLAANESPELRELIVRGRILSLIYYLESIQE